MTTHRNRGRINLLPLDSNRNVIRHKVLAGSMPKGWKAEALTDDGMLMRCSHTGTLAIWQGDRLISVNANKAEAALRVGKQP